ncbi:MAG: hypothetical protein IPM85_13330 [Chitinophagaceae bacterium]|nr:hypothetical protein [Chitinophagaceae bacterium]
MNKKVILNILVSFITAISYSQQKFCADSSIRIKYKSGNPNYFLGGAFYPDTNGYSMLLGAYNNATSTENGMIIAKNNWGDSIYWSKKYTSITNVILSAHNIIKNSNDVLLVTGERKYLGSTDFMLCRIDTNGNILWSRFFPLKTGHINYIGLVNKNSRIVFPTNNAIYISLPLDNLQTIFKLDLNGNLIWSKGLYTLPLFSSSPVYGIFEKNGVIYFTMNKIRQAPNTSIIYSGTIITGLNESDGSINESVLLSIIPDNLAKGLHSINLNYNNDGTVLLTGFVCLSLPGAGIEANPNTMFNLQLNNAFNLIRGNYYKTDITSGLALRFDINSLKQSIFYIIKNLTLLNTF